jgi:hypothetical protein
LETLCNTLHQTTSPRGLTQFVPERIGLEEKCIEQSNLSFNDFNLPHRGRELILALNQLISDHSLPYALVFLNIRAFANSAPPNQSV